MAFKKFDITFYKIQNPTSASGFATVSQITRLNKEFREIYLRVRNEIDLTILKESDNKYIFIAKIPSENLDNIKYDLVLEMEKKPEETSFLNAPLKIFSNDPSFMFSYTWVMAQNDTIPEKLLPKCSTIALQQPPEIRNPMKLWHLHKYSILLRYHILYKGYLNPRYLEKDWNRIISYDTAIRNIPTQVEKYEEVKQKYPQSKYKNLDPDRDINKY